MKKYAFWNAILAVPISFILIIRGAWVFINSSDKSQGNSYFIAGLLVCFFGIMWALAYKRLQNSKSVS